MKNKCLDCEHQRVCFMYKQYIKELEKLDLIIEIKECKEFD